mmetsp:Transcript_3233/g.5712  ORF Transcript_3233/g.5712 Transcript_3233/m.5712 type:complete len:214 (-) Transcript_3233:3-644(-)
MTGFHTSCFARYFSTTHSTPPNNAVSTPNCLAQPLAFAPVALYPERICSRRGAGGTSLPFMTSMADVSPPIAPMKRPRPTPMKAPMNAPLIIFPPQVSPMSRRGVRVGSPFGKSVLLKNGSGQENVSFPYIRIERSLASPVFELAMRTTRRDKRYVPVLFECVTLQFSKTLREGENLNEIRKGRMKRRSAQITALIVSYNNTGMVMMKVMRQE